MACHITSEADARLLTSTAHIHDDSPTNVQLRPFRSLRSSNDHLRDRHRNAEDAAFQNRVEVLELPRGGVIVKTKVGSIQFGMPPETLKDSLLLGLEVPIHYVLPTVRFDRKNGVNVAEFEFPTYFNYFIRKRKCVLILTTEAEEAVRTVFQETLLGPKLVDISEEIAADYPEDLRPDLRKELDFFAIGFNSSARLTVDSMLEFINFNPNSNTAEVGEGVSIRKEAGKFIVNQDGIDVAMVEDRVDLPLQYPNIDEEETVPDICFEPPLFGVTVLGSSHGFDPHGSVSGYVIWVNGRGIFVDPPPHSSKILKRYGIPASLIDCVILSHCHADHDAGTFQKILEESKVTIMTTPTVLGSFLRKYSAVSGIPEKTLRRLFVFRPASIGRALKLHGAEFNFFYSLHAIPCIGFEVYFGGKSIFFSGDTCNDPPRLNALYEAGVLKEGRLEFLKNCPWNHSIILHEAGVPPIHTPVSTFVDKHDSVKDRLYLVHVASKDVPSDCGLKCASTGVENTIRIDVTPLQHGEAIQLLDLVTSMEIFRNLSVENARDILLFFRKQFYPKGSTVITAGSTDNPKFFVIASGRAQVVLDKPKGEMEYTTGDYFGETSILTGAPRAADIVAGTDLVVYEVDKGDFLYLFRHSETIIRRMLHIARMRSTPSWEVINSNSILRELTAAQKTRLQGILHETKVSKGQYLWRAASEASVAYLIEDGEFILTTLEEGSLDPFRKGAFFCDLDKMKNELPHLSTLRAATDSTVFSIYKDDLFAYFSEYPGLMVILLDTEFVE
eukprot:GILK01008231.1.p1 GENE.GILK01008231.1~~GILK01008231.1.p1  ORF type:complete len:784 (+),score=143.48 GILK01008231.1:66-2417(+)